MVQYKTLIRTSIGAPVTERIFLTLKNVGDRVKSAKRPARKVREARARPIIVRY